MRAAGLVFTVKSKSDAMSDQIVLRIWPLLGWGWEGRVKVAWGGEGAPCMLSYVRVWLTELTDCVQSGSIMSV